MMMTKGAFIISQDEKNPRDINFQLASSNIEIPEDQALLQDEVARALTVIRIAFDDDDDRFEEYFRSLLSLAQAGLVGPSAQPKAAMRALTALKYDITSRESGRIKNRYMKSLGLYAIIIGGLFTAFGLYLTFFVDEQQLLAAFMFLWTGCMAGVWLSFGIRKTTLKFEELHILEEDRMEPVVRLIFAGLLTTIIAFLLISGAVVLTIGDLTTTEFESNLIVQLLIGSLCGFSEHALPSKIASQALTFLSSGR